MADGYNATYGGEDIGESTIDLVVSVIANLWQYAALIAVFLLIRWFTKK